MELTIVNRKGIKFTVLYDSEDHPIVMLYKWYVGTDGYVRTVQALPQLMHRLIMGVKDPLVHVDHENHNLLDNRRLNLRKCTRSENMANRKPRGESKYLGVSYQRYKVKGKEYCYIIATILNGGKKKTLGRFKNEESAAIAYDDAAKEIHGKFANLNFKK